MDEIQLRSALRLAQNCPSIEVLSTQLTGAAGDEARASAELHLGQCLHCRTELDLLHEFANGTIRPDETASVKWITARLQKHPHTSKTDRATGWWTGWRIPKVAVGLAGVALVTLLAVGISSEWKLRQSITRPAPEFGHEVQRTRLIETVRTPGFFDWKPVAGAVRYELTVRTVDGTSIFHNSFTGTTLAFPSEVDALFKSGKLLEWEVTARDSAGTEIAGSGVQGLRKAASSSH